MDTVNVWYARLTILLRNVLAFMGFMLSLLGFHAFPVPCLSPQFAWGGLCCNLWFSRLTISLPTVRRFVQWQPDSSGTRAGLPMGRVRRHACFPLGVSCCMLSLVGFHASCASKTDARVKNHWFLSLKTVILGFMFSLVGFHVFPNAGFMFSLVGFHVFPSSQIQCVYVMTLAAVKTLRPDALITTRLDMCCCNLWFSRLTISLRTVFYVPGFMFSLVGFHVLPTSTRRTHCEI